MGCSFSERRQYVAGNTGSACSFGTKQLTGTRSKTAADQRDAFMLPSCHKQVEAVQKNAKSLGSHVGICKLDNLPRRKASMQMTMQRRGAINGVRSAKRTVKGSANGR